MGSTESFDLIVIGCGPAGEKAGAQAAYFGKSVAVIERAQHMGGSCINTGTVPSKTLRESALYFSGLRQRGLYGIDYSLKENLTVHDFMHHEREVVEMERRRDCFRQRPHLRLRHLSPDGPHPQKSCRDRRRRHWLRIRFHLHGSWRERHSR